MINCMQENKNKVFDVCGKKYLFKNLFWKWKHKWILKQCQLKRPVHVEFIRRDVSLVPVPPTVKLRSSFWSEKEDSVTFHLNKPFILEDLKNSGLELETSTPSQLSHHRWVFLTQFNLYLAVNADLFWMFCVRLRDIWPEVGQFKSRVKLRGVRSHDPFLSGPHCDLWHFRRWCAGSAWR